MLGMTDTDGRAIVAIAHEPLTESGDPCPYCDTIGALVQALVEVQVPEDGRPGLVWTDYACCVACVSAVVADEHHGDDTPRVILADGAPHPEGVVDPQAE